MRFALALAALFTAVSASNVIDLTPENFDSVVGQGKPGLVELCVVVASVEVQRTDWYTVALRLGGAYSV